MKTAHLINRCPVCTGRMTVSELRCEECDVSVRGRFEVPALCRLPKELYEFLLVFVRNRGVIREVERELGISYPTVRSRLDAVLAALDTGGAGVRVTAESDRVIEMLERGEVTPEEAERMLRGEEPGGGNE
ncbi:MAG TPA: DUF2089 domain-containing protein [candidate division WOR-3 bacterium]|uniref:DUF2089 domain-containing protein n=1 Tax=candidate division WOR-3 bacterium TaxID=2052148 RepID=A0A7V0T6Y4_UNCW3|nr:DUF2089 domain-containing protein [candidate division WOR-3 bacterium]